MIEVRYFGALRIERSNVDFGAALVFFHMNICIPRFSKRQALAQVLRGVTLEEAGRGKRHPR